MKKWKKRTIWVVIVLALISGGIFYFSSKKTSTTYITEEAGRIDVKQTVSVTGEINPENIIDLGFKTSGIVKEMNVNVGDTVEKGQRLSKVDPSTLLAELEASNQDIEYYDETYDYMKDNKSTYEKEQREAQKALIRKAEALNRAARIKIGETYIYSPIAGTIIKRNADLGEIAIFNSTILTVAEGEMEIKSDVPESDIIKVSLGQKADISFDAFPSDVKFEANIIKIEPASTVIQDVVYYKVKLRLDNVDERIKPGMSCDVDIKTAEKKNVIAIPLRAVKTEGDKKYVEVLKDEKNNITEKVFVATGLEGDDGIVEISSGLKGGEKVITLTSEK
ncbi:MAG: efflux RND transporter periplasmic adaptor subunit [Parcubacteria group bacterium]|jgi:HlyD family secretion protein